MAKCRIDSFRLRGTRNICHMFLLTLHSVTRVGFGFSSVTFRLSRTNRVLEVARIFTKHSKCCEKSFVLTMSLYTFILLLYKQLLQYTLLNTFTVPSALLTKFPKKFQTILLASAFVLQNCPRKHFCFDTGMFYLSIKGCWKTRPHRSSCLLSLFKLHCQRGITEI